jgi:ADP-heptose:LPS heptosyltransferase
MSAKKILVVHLSRLGDMVQSLPAVKLLKDDEPDCQITYLGIEDFCRILVGNPWIDRLVTLPWQDIQTLTGEFTVERIPEIDSLLKRIPEIDEYYDLAINMTHDRVSSYITYRVRASERSGRLFSQNNELFISGNWGKFLFAMSRYRKETLINLVDLYIGMAGVRNRPVRHYLPTTPDVDNRCHDILIEMGLKEGDKVIGFQLGASKASRMWPLENFVKLGESLTANTGARIILFGSEQEKVLAQQFQALASYPVINLAGRMTLMELPSFLKALDVMVTNDTGPMHIAAAVGTRIVALFMGIAYYGFTGPYGEGHVIIQSNYPCSPCLDSTSCDNTPCRESINPETVEEAVNLIIYPHYEMRIKNSGADLFRSFFRENGTLGYQQIRPENDEYQSWIQNSNFQMAVVSQELWNRWLGLPCSGNETLPLIVGQTEGILRSYNTECRVYRALYDEGENLCRKIIREYRNNRPNIRIIEKYVRALQELDGNFKEMNGPLSILKELHEPFFAEIPVCNFPELATHFLSCYRNLRNSVGMFENILSNDGWGHNICSDKFDLNTGT